MAVSAADVAERLADLQARVEGAGGEWHRITVVAVTKDFGADAVEAALANGLRDCGENRADQLVAKAAAVTGVSWHYLGRVQRNKVTGLAPHVRLWQAVDRMAAGEDSA